MLYGVDVSSYTGKDTFATLLDEYDFVIMKASEGKTYKSPSLDWQYDMLRGCKDGKPSPDKLYGFYHYARPENNSPHEEVDNFLSLVSHHAGYAIFALDWEGTAVSYDNNWARQWIREVRERTGVTPMLYCPKWAIPSWTQEEDVGLWLPDWSMNHLDVDKLVAIRQIEAVDKGGYDKNHFFGTADQFRAYAQKR